MLCNFLLRKLQYLKKKYLSFFGHENMKKLTSKVAYLQQFGFFSLCSPNFPKQPRIDNSFYRIMYPMICGTISGSPQNTAKNYTSKIQIFSYDQSIFVCHIQPKSLRFLRFMLSLGVRNPCPAASSQGSQSAQEHS